MQAPKSKSKSKSRRNQHDDLRKDYTDQWFSSPDSPYAKSVQPETETAMETETPKGKKEDKAVEGVHVKKKKKEDEDVVEEVVESGCKGPGKDETLSTARSKVRPRV